MITNVLNNDIQQKCSPLRILMIVCLLFVIVYFSIMSRPSFASLFRNVPIPERLWKQQVNATVRSIRCIVTVRKSEGRLGNRLFMIANAYGLARLHSCHLYFPPTVLHDVQNLFLLDFSTVGLLSTTTFDLFLRQNHSKSMHLTQTFVVCAYIKELSRPNAIGSNEIYELLGFWQSYLHFINYRNEILEKVFCPLPKVLKATSRLFVDVCEKYFDVKVNVSSDRYSQLKNELLDFNQTTWIGIHIRRTDFLGLGFSSSEDYLRNATTFFLDRYPDAFFIVASDDKPYAHELFRQRDNFLVTPSSFSIDEDLISLSLCEHLIVTAGTFGWWAAFLSDGLVMHDRIYPSGCDKREHYYPPWYLLPGNVRAQKNSEYVNR